MPAAARLGDKTTHGGVVIAPAPPTVLIGGMPAALAGDEHLCPIPQHPPSVFAKGSVTVLISGRPALRAGDVAGCGAFLVGGAVTVQVGG